MASGPVVLLGTSLGAAVALQETADDSRVIGIVAAEVFSDLRTVARERAPAFLTERMITRAFQIAERRADFRVDDVSPREAAQRLRIPVLLIHGNRDVDTPPEHSWRVFAALAGPKEIVMVDGARHNESLQSTDTWQRIDRWLDHISARRPDSGRRF
ncbi:MAG TPA: prolyl oligopeptidase family serine peptidase [Vicinamibacterales bacterium]|nr:prolyl oligopeptidase family serine peptidase [Vicinamibacterales bacterium]